MSANSDRCTTTRTGPVRAEDDRNNQHCRCRASSRGSAGKSSKLGTESEAQTGGPHPDAGRDMEGITRVFVPSRVSLFAVDEGSLRDSHSDFRTVTLQHGTTDISGSGDRNGGSLVQSSNRTIRTKVLRRSRVLLSAIQYSSFRIDGPRKRT